MNIGALLLIAVGGYILYKHFYAPTTTTTGSQVTPSSPQFTDNLLLTKQLMATKARDNAFYISQGGLLDWHQWNYIYREVRGVDAPQPDTDTQVRLTLDEWINVTFRPGLGGSIRVSDAGKFERANVRYI